MPQRSLTIAALVLLAPALAACSGTDEPGANGARSPLDTGAGTSLPHGDEDRDGGCATDTVLTVVTEDGPQEISAVTSYADVVGTDSQSGTFTFSNAQISVDDARSVLQPTDLAEGEVVVILSVQGAGDVTLGTYPPREAATTEAKVTFYAVYDSTGRVFGPEPVVELTYAEDGTVCGILSGEGDEPGTVTGSFVAQRIDTGATKIR